MLTPWKEVMTNLDSMLKTRDIILPTKIHLVKAMVFPVVMYGCKSWTVKKAEHWRIDAFELWCWRRLLRVPWTARRSKQSILKEISPGCSLEGMMLKLKLQYFGHLMRRVDSWKRPWCWKGLGAGGEGDDRGWDGWMASLTRSTWVWVNSRSWWWIGRPGMLQFMGSKRGRLNSITELNWTERSPYKKNNASLFQTAVYFSCHAACIMSSSSESLSWFLIPLGDQVHQPLVKVCINWPLKCPAPPTSPSKKLHLWSGLLSHHSYLLVSHFHVWLPSLP